MNYKILCVDDDGNILEGFKRRLKKRFHLDTALSGHEGLKAISEKGPYALVISDMRMPGMDGIQFLSKVGELAPDTVRAMLTGNADMETAINAVNEGQIFRFLTKPCHSELLAKTMEAGIAQYRLLMAEKELLEKTLSRSLGVLVDILSIVNPIAFSKAARFRRYVRQIIRELKLPNSWQYELAALMSQIGCVALTPEVLEKVNAGQKLSQEEREMFSSHPALGSKLLQKIPRLENVAVMIEKQNLPFKRFTASGKPEKPDTVTMGAQILKTALDFDRLFINGMSAPEAVERMLQRPEECNPSIVKTLRNLEWRRMGSTVKLVKISELDIGMVIDQNVSTNKGVLVVTKGQEVNYLLLERLKNFRSNRSISGELRVLVPEYGLPDDKE